MSALDKVLKNYQRRKYLDTEVRWMTRQDAAKYLGVSIQRINQLVKFKRLRTLNEERRGVVNPVREEDVLGYIRGTKGRPKANPGQIRAIPQVRSKFGFKLYQKVIYEHPTEFGYTTRIPAKIVHFGPIKVLIELFTTQGVKKELWVQPRQLESKNKKGEETVFFVKYQHKDQYALIICSPTQWRIYLNRWKKVLLKGSGYITSDGTVVTPEEFYNNYFLTKFEVKPITKIMAARFSRFLNGKSFGKFPEQRRV